MERKLRSRKQKRMRHRLPVHVYLAYLLACTMLATSVTFSSYVTGASCTMGTARVAAGAASAGAKTRSSLLEIDCNTNQHSASYDFIVSNSNGGKASQVALGYDVVVTLNQALPDGVSLTLDGRSGNGSRKKYTFSNVGTFRASTRDNNTHTLKFTANSSRLFDAATIGVQISVHTYQID